MGVVSGITLYDIIGVPRACGHVLFVPARFEFLQNQAGKPVGFMEEDLTWFDDDQNELEIAAFGEWDHPLWYRARTSALFDITQPADEFNEELFFEFPFIAVIRPERWPLLTAVPFVFTGGFNTYLQFLESESINHQQDVNYAFCELLHTSPLILMPFEGFRYDEQAGGEWVGFDGRSFYADESFYSPDDDYDFAPTECFDRCPDCDNSPEYPISPAVARCETCDGMGILPFDEAISQGSFALKW